MMNVQMTRRTLSLVALVVLHISCAHSLIEGTQIHDTQQNRRILDVVTTMHHAFENLDADAITSLVSKHYFEDMGNSDPSDDYGYDTLVSDVLPKSMKIAKKFSVQMEIQRVNIEGKAAYADIRYLSRAQLKLPAGTLWDSHEEFNRVEFAQENGQWLIVSGL